MNDPILVEGSKYWHSHSHFPMIIGKVFAENDDRQHDSNDFTGVCHTHDHPELVIVSGGVAHHKMEGEDYPVSAGDVFCILGSQMHYYSEMNQLQLLNIMYDPQGLKLPLDILRKLPGYNAMFMLEPNYRKEHAFSSRLTLAQPELAQAVNIVETMYSEQSSRSSGYEACMFSGLIRLIIYLSQHYGKHSSSVASALLRIDRVLIALEEESDKPWTLQDMADLAEISSASLIRTFKKAVGIPPLEYLIQLRIRQSMELLAGTEMTITDIAFEIGFHDSNYFARQFKRINGISASQYRNRTKVE